MFKTVFMEDVFRKNVAFVAANFVDLISRKRFWNENGIFQIFLFDTRDYLIKFVFWWYISFFDKEKKNSFSRFYR